MCNYRFEPGRQNVAERDHWLLMLALANIQKVKK